MAEKKSFMLYQNYETIFEELDMRQRGELISAIFAYTGGNSDAARGMKGALRMAFVCIKDGIDRDRASYLARCEQNAQNARRRKSDGKRSLASAADNDNDNEHDHDNEHERDNDHEHDNDLDLERSIAPQKGARSAEKKSERGRSGRGAKRELSSFDTDDFFEAALKRAERPDAFTSGSF